MRNQDWTKPALSETYDLMLFAQLTAYGFVPPSSIESSDEGGPQPAEEMNFTGLTTAVLGLITILSIACVT